VQVSVLGLDIIRRPRVAVFAPVLIGAVALLLAGPSADAQAAPSPSALPAAAWLEAQLAANGHLMPNSFPGAPPDLGLTEDVVLALTAAGNGQDAETRAATAKVAAGLDEFVTAGAPGFVLAGSVAKSALVAEVQGADVTSFGGRDLEHDLRTIMTATGAQAGRFADQGNPTDSSNGFSQAFGILALDRTNGGVPAPAVSYLLAQQCPSGAFRLFYDSGPACTDSTEADTDATALAVQALAALPSSASVTTAIGNAAAWLVAHQNATTGALSSSGPAAAPNSNTTGLAVVALRLAGQSSAADKGQAYVERVQLSCGRDTGAIAFDPIAYADAAGNGTIDDSALDQWRRATAQAVLGLGLPAYGDVSAVSAGPTVTPTATRPSGCSSSSSSHTSGHSQHGTSTSGATVLGIRASADPGLPATGGLPVGLLLLAAMAVAAGVAVTWLATDRTARHR
jgi:Prenyltransferase and squalene oxidase repeat